MTINDKSKGNKMKDLKLTDVEIHHILNLLQENQDAGWYYGQRKHYYARTQKLIDLFGLLLYRKKVKP